MFEILKKEWLTREICLMDIYAPNLAQSALPGHFLIVRTHEKGRGFLSLYVIMTGRKRPLP